MNFARSAVMIAMLGFSLGSHAQTNETMTTIVTIATNTVDAANNVANSVDKAANILNQTNSLVPSVLAKLDEIKAEVRTMTNIVERVTATSYMVSTSAAVVAVAVAIGVSFGAAFVFGRHMANKHNCCRAAEVEMK